MLGPPVGPAEVREVAHLVEQVSFVLAAGCGLYHPLVAKGVMVAVEREAPFEGVAVLAEVLEHVSRVVVVHVVFEEPQAGSFVGPGGDRLVSAEAGSAQEIVADAIVSGAGKAVDFSFYDFHFRGNAGVDEGSEDSDDDGEDGEHCGELTYEWVGIRKVIVLILSCRRCTSAYRFLRERKRNKGNLYIKIDNAFFSH